MGLMPGTMTLAEAIQHTREVAARCDNELCAAEHRQLMEWLSELAERKNNDRSNTQNPVARSP